MVTNQASDSNFSIRNSILLILLLLISNVFVLQLLVSVGLVTKGSPISIGLALLIFYGVVVIAVYLFAKATVHDPLRALGFNKVNIFKALNTVIVGIFAIITVSFLYSAAMKMIGVKTPDLEKTVTMMFGDSTLGLVITFIAVVIIAPFAEELLFRGYLYPSFRQKLGVARGLIISSALFALLHFSALIFFPVYFFIGFVLGYAREKDGSIITPIILHALNNGFFFIFLAIRALR